VRPKRLLTVFPVEGAGGRRSADGAAPDIAIAMGSHRAANPDNPISPGWFPGGLLSQTAELARLKARIKAMTDKTVANGCTDAGAMSAAEMVGRSPVATPCKCVTKVVRA
jgi:hypothetical protein